MKESQTKPISALLQPSHRDLQTILSKAKAIETLNRTLIPLLDPAIQKYCQVANLTNGVLIVLTANGAVATQLRYHVTDIIKKLHQNPALKHIREIQIKVRPAAAPVGVERGKAPTTLTKPLPMSPETAQTLAAMAETIEDPELREIMLRIAAHSE